MRCLDKAAGLMLNSSDVQCMRWDRGHSQTGGCSFWYLSTLATKKGLRLQIHLYHPCALSGHMLLKFAWIRSGYLSTLLLNSLAYVDTEYYYSRFAVTVGGQPIFNPE